MRAKIFVQNKVFKESHWRLIFEKEDLQKLYVILDLSFEKQDLQKLNYELHIKIDTLEKVKKEVQSKCEGFEKLTLKFLKG